MGQPVDSGRAEHAYGWDASDARRQAMDPRAITLAQLDFEEFNEQVRTRGRSRMLAPGERRLAWPEFPMRAFVRLHTAARSWIDMLRLNWAVRPARPRTEA